MADFKLNRKVPISLVVAAVLMLAGAGAAVALKPTHMIADDKPAMDLEQIVPKAFGQWRTDDSITPLTVDPTVQAKLDAIYSQSLQRTFINNRGERVMVSIAYGKNQNSQSTAVHRPEFCYGAQGFHVESRGISELQLKTHSIKTVRLLADQEQRIEPITYWVTLNEDASIPGLDRKLAQLRYGLQGLIVDGMLVRVSSFADDKNSVDYTLHQEFLREMESALPAEFKSRFFGS
ncbi:MAG TPA: EpsI family protein [Aquabacterium sp.]|nr:EpsI family protein [Aquabacterium sp.]HRH28839.1 EpsI family protein [Aquabacterium sp.]